MRPRVIACEVKLVYRLFLTVLILIGVLAVASMSVAEQVPDMSWEPEIENPAYISGEGPIVMVDEGHFNFHTIGYRYIPFAKLLRLDGYTVEPLSSEFREDSLSACDILVISNSLSERNENDWCLPTPSAFSDEEIAAVRDWVINGGSLLLIADHKPFPGCAEKLGAAFGLRFNNGFAFKTEQREIIEEGWLTFSRSDESLANHAITHGRSIGEEIDLIMSFTGQAFQSDVDVRPLLTIGADVVSFMPECAWEFHDTTPQIPVEGWLQGAVLSLGSGRIAVFGEAAMFSAQIKDDGRLMGMNAPGAEQNFQFVLNVMHWLSGLLDDDKNLTYTPVIPCRIADTRIVGGAITPGGLRSYDVRGAVVSQGGNPAGCPSPGGEPRGVQLSVTAVPVVGAGHLRLFPFDTPTPHASALNYKTGSNIANAVSVQACYGCTKDVNVQSFGGTTHVVIDVMGYYCPAP